MSAHQCACGQPAPHTTICAGCERSLTLALLSAITLGPALDDALARQVRFGDRAGRSSAHPLPFDERASAAAAGLRAELTRWVRALAPQDHPAATIAGMALQLARTVPAIRQHESAASIHHGITAAVAQAQRAVDRPPARVYAGPCPVCGADLIARPGRDVITCACGQPSVVADQRQAMREAIEDHLGDARYASRIATGLGWPTTPERIRQWAHRGKLTQRPGGLYRVGDVLDLAARQNLRM